MVDFWLKQILSQDLTLLSDTCQLINPLYLRPKGTEFYGENDKTADFKKRYGDKWESVMYAVATNVAKKKV